MRWALIFILALAACENLQPTNRNEMEAIATDVARNVTTDHPRVEGLYRRMRQLEDRVAD